jgi:uncharacterized membrane protein YagU involved in acid resistance
VTIQPGRASLDSESAVHRASAMRLNGMRPWQAIIAAGFVAGLLDGLETVIFNWVVRGIAPIRIFHYIASGLLGVKAFRGGWSTAAIGLALHLFFSISAAAAYYFLSRRLMVMRKRPLLGGAIFGLILFAFMQSLVIPLCAAPQQPPATLGLLLNLTFAHIFCIGLPIAWMTSRSKHQLFLPYSSSH